MASAPAVLGVVPARFASRRFPGKLLADLCGKPVVVRTVEAAQRATSLSDVWVATDDVRIGQAVASGCPRTELVFTDPGGPSGSDRIVAALGARGFLSTTAVHDHLVPGTAAPQDVLASFPFEAIVNVQGDEPLIDPAHIDAAVRGLLDNPGADIATLVYRLDTTLQTVSC